MSRVTGALVRVGIVSWNTDGLLDRCLASLPAAMTGHDVEVVVVDNASSDDSVAVAASHGGVKVITNVTNLGYARAMNMALAGSDASVLIALNPDTEAAHGSLAALTGRLLENPGVGLVAPRLVDAAGRAQYTGRRFPSLGGAVASCLLPVRWQGGRLGQRLLLEAAPPPPEPANVDWAIGAVHVIRASALRGRPPYDERWFMYAEDLELCWWLAQRGWLCRLESDITVSHAGHAAGSQAWGDGHNYERRCFDAIYDWYQRDVGRPSVRALAAVNAANAASRAAVGRVAHRPADHVDNRWQAARYHAGVARRGPIHPGGLPDPAPPPAEPG
ncbi:MAG: glycosyltransferase [Acidimicrobiales bacterium]